MCLGKLLGTGLRYEPEEWKDIFSATINKQRIVPSIDGKGIVMLGVSTRKQSVQWFNEMMMVIEVFGAENCVKFTAPDYYPTSGSSQREA